MAGVVDVLLKIVGDSRDAVRSVNDVGDAAERSTGKVNTLGSRLAGLGAQIGSAIGFAGLIQAGAEQVAQQIDQVLGLGKPADLHGATSSAEVANRLSNIASGFSFSRLVSPFGTWKQLADVRNLVTGGTTAGQRANIDALAAGSEAEREALRQAVPSLPSGLASYATGALARGQQAQAYQASLTAAAKAGVANITVNTGVGDRNAIGREVRAALDARDRNNGRYVQTNTRR